MVVVEKRAPVVNDQESTLKGLVLLAVTPLIGLAYVVFLPLVGIGMIFAALAVGLATKLGWAQK